MVSTPELSLHLIFVGLASLACQGFFIHRSVASFPKFPLKLTRHPRIWTFSRGNWVLTGVLSAACLTSFALGVLIAAQIIIVPDVAYFSGRVAEVITVFSLGAAVDVAIALVLVFYLQQGTTQFDRWVVWPGPLPTLSMRTHSLSTRTSFVIARVMHYTVATGLATRCVLPYLSCGE
jgi:hypothetical protein